MRSRRRTRSGQRAGAGRGWLWGRLSGGPVRLPGYGRTSPGERGQPARVLPEDRPVAPGRPGADLRVEAPDADGWDPAGLPGRGGLRSCGGLRVSAEPRVFGAPDQEAARRSHRRGRACSAEGAHMALGAPGLKGDCGAAWVAVCVPRVGVQRDACGHRARPVARAGLRLAREAPSRDQQRARPGVGRNLGRLPSAARAFHEGGRPRTGPGSRRERVGRRLPGGLNRAVGVRGCAGVAARGSPRATRAGHPAYTRRSDSGHGIQPGDAPGRACG